jgi:hypothetical protein
MRHVDAPDKDLCSLSFAAGLKGEITTHDVYLRSSWPWGRGWKPGRLDRLSDRIKPLSRVSMSLRGIDARGEIASVRVVSRATVLNTDATSGVSSTPARKAANLRSLNPRNYLLILTHLNLRQWLICHLFSARRSINPARIVVSAVLHRSLESEYPR